MSTSNGWLNLTEVSSESRGWYKCATEHTFGRFSSHSVYINVLRTSLIFLNYRNKVYFRNDSIHYVINHKSLTQLQLLYVKTFFSLEVNFSLIIFFICDRIKKKDFLQTVKVMLSLSSSKFAECIFAFYILKI